MPHVKGGSKGLYFYDLHHDGRLELCGTAFDGALVNPTYACVNQARTRVYVVTETVHQESQLVTLGLSEDAGKSAVQCEVLGSVSAGGTSGCHVMLNAKETHLFAANYTR